MPPPRQVIASVSCSLSENGQSDSASPFVLENGVQESLHQPLQGISEAMRRCIPTTLLKHECMATICNVFMPVIFFLTSAVAKTLRHADEGKASAQAEASEWKRKYALEKARNLQLEHKVPTHGNHVFDLPNKRNKVVVDQSQVCLAENGQNEHCCGTNGICTHEVLREGEPISDFGLVNTKFARKASFKLSWSLKAENGNQYKHDVVSVDKGSITTAERSSKQIFLKWETDPRTVLVLTKPNSTPVQLLCFAMIRWLKKHKKLDIYVEPCLRSELLDESSEFDFVRTWKDDKEVLRLHTKVDLVVTLGGDGTVLWAASLFKGPVPPVVPFSMGSLGFMTKFYSQQYKESLDSILQGPLSITLRHRLQCHIIRESTKSDIETEEPTMLVLNEVTIDRGISSYLSNLECYCDNIFVTRVQGDGLIVSTTSGSTAYSLAAGGSMVHPQVPGILFTPICPHSLSFRPLILPEYVTLRVQVPNNSRGSAWVSFDGKDRKQLAPGDALICSIAPWPVPMACQVDSISDFLSSIHDGLHWNMRKTQTFDGPSLAN